MDIMKKYLQYIKESTKTKEEQLLEEIVVDNVNNVEKLLKEGANPNHISHSGAPILLIAISKWIRSNKKLKITKLLVKYGADVNITNDHGIYPLYYSSFNNNLDIVKFLIQNGANFKYECYEKSKNTAIDNNSICKYYESYEGQKEILEKNISAFPELKKVGLNPKIEEEYVDILKQSEWS